MQLKGNAENIGQGRALMGGVVGPSIVRSVAWSAFGHGDVVFVLMGNWNPATGHVHPDHYVDIMVLRQALGEDATPILPLTIPSGATLQFLASAKSGAESASFVAEIETIPPAP